MHELLNEPVDVLVEFSDKRVKPKILRWQGKHYPIQSVNLIHGAREGRIMLFYFSVSSDTIFFKLRLHSETLEWRIVEIYCD